MVKAIQHRTPSPIPYVAASLVLLAGGYWWFYLRQTPSTVITAPRVSPQGQSRSSVAQSPAPSDRPFPLPASVPAGTLLRIDGSTSMVGVNRNLKRGFESTFPGTQVTASASGSSQGIQAVLTGKANLAAVSRPLTAAETGQGLQSVAIASDPIAIVVSSSNPFKGGLTTAQVQSIFQGKIRNWKQVGGANLPLRVINRPAISGTHQAFRELALNKGYFGNTPNIVTLNQDATTPLLRALGNNGIGYATYSQVVNQKTVRVIPINGLAPTAQNYPYNRVLSYVYKKPPTPVVQAFLGYAFSDAGQKVIFQEN